MADTASSGNRRLYVMTALFAVILTVVIVAVLQMTGYLSSRTCDIHAKAEFVSRDAPVSRALHVATDMLMLRNQDGDTWRDVELSVVGYENIGAKGRQPSGVYVLPPDKLHDKGGLYAIQMNDFEKAGGGSRWVSLTMTPETFTVKATVNGKSCRAEVAPGQK
jgi:hypothetical protein